MRYTWGYIKEAVFATMDIDTDEANERHFINRIHIYANEALTQICSIKPKHAALEVRVYTVREAWEYCVNKYGTYRIDDNILLCEVNRPSKPSPSEQLFWKEYDSIVKVGRPFHMPDDFICWHADIITVTNAYGITYEAHDDDMRYVGDNIILFNTPGFYCMTYNARWTIFTSTMDNDVELDIPHDICDALIPYIISRLYKADDEVKAQIYNNEFEIALARIDDTDWRQTTTIKVDGGW